MSKISSSKLKSLASSFRDEFIITDGSVLKCDACDSILKIDPKHQNQAIQQHVRTLRHREVAKIRNAKANPQQSFLGVSFEKAAETTSKNKDFESDLTRALIQSDIPLFKVNAPPFRKFLEKYTQKKMPDESTLRKNYVKPIYCETIDKIRSIVGDSNVCFIVDETTDALKRFVFNVLVMPLKAAYVKPMLIKVSTSSPVYRLSI